MDDLLSFCLLTSGSECWTAFTPNLARFFTHIGSSFSSLKYHFYWIFLGL